LRYIFLSLPVAGAGRIKIFLGIGACQANWSTRVPCPGGSGGNGGGLYALAASLASPSLFTSVVLSGVFSGVLVTAGLTGGGGAGLATVEMLMAWILAWIPGLASWAALPDRDRLALNAP
jgi:hypothetical protein